MAAIKPACSGEPVTDRINHGKANVETCDPMADTICPLHSSKKSRCRHNEAGRATAVGLPGFPALCTSDMVRYFHSMLDLVSRAGASPAPTLYGWAPGLCMVGLASSGTGCASRYPLSIVSFLRTGVSPMQNFVLAGLIYNRNLFIIVGKAGAFLRRSSMQEINVPIQAEQDARTLVE